MGARESDLTFAGIRRVDIWGQVACVRVTVNNSHGASHGVHYMGIARHQLLCMQFW
jgi:hypothetical protein